MSECRDTLAALLDRGVAAWHGLPRGCPPGDLAPVVRDLDPTPGMANLGLRRAFFRFGTLTGSDAAVQLWTTIDETQTEMLAVDRPPFATTGRAAVEALGPPGERLDAARGTVPLAASEWVYAERGLALFVDPDTDEVWRATLFPACTPAEYGEQFRVSQLVRRLR